MIFNSWIIYISIFVQKKKNLKSYFSTLYIWNEYINKTKSFIKKKIYICIKTSKPYHLNFKKWAFRYI